MENIVSIVLGIFLGFVIVPKKPSTYQVACQGWPIEEPNDNLALIGVGLATARSSVMDAPPPNTPPQIQIMNLTPASPVPMAPVATALRSPVAPLIPTVQAPIPVMVHSPSPMAPLIPTVQAPIPVMVPSPSPMATPCIVQKLDPRACVTSSEPHFLPYNVNITPPTNGGESCDSVVKKQFGPTWSIQQTPYGTNLVNTPGGC